MSSHKLHKFQENIFDFTFLIIYILYFAIALGLSATAPKYLSFLDYYVKIYVSLFLIWRFNPFRKIHTFTNLDRKIAFSAGLFIITTTALNKYIIETKERVQKIINSNQQKQ